MLNSFVSSSASFALPCSDAHSTGRLCRKGRQVSQADAVTLGDSWLAPAIKAGYLQPIKDAKSYRWWVSLQPKHVHTSNSHQHVSVNRSISLQKLQSEVGSQMSVIGPHLKAKLNVSTCHKFASVARQANSHDAHVHMVKIMYTIT